MQFSKWSHEIIAVVLVAAVFAIGIGNSPQLTGMVINVIDEPQDTVEKIIEDEILLGEGCEYVDIPYTENVCTDQEFEYSIKLEQFLNSRYAIEHVCTGVVRLKNEDTGPGRWKIGYVFEIDGEYYQADPITNYIESGKEGVFKFERMCEEDTEFDGVYYIIEQPTKYLCGPIAKYKKEIKCGLQEE